MATPVIITELQVTNSTSYADVAGVLTGTDRLHGETTDVYLERMKTASVEDKSHSYEGIVNSIAFSLGLSVQPGISIAGPENTVVNCDLSGISLVSGAKSFTFPLAVIGEDNVWDWNSLSQIVSAINSTTTWQAILMSLDGPAVQLCRQTNSGVGMPYECVVSDVGLIGLTESSLPALAIAVSGNLSYQLTEFIQSIMQTDQSYWPR